MIIFFSQSGAEVIKIEPPKVGDPLRVWRELDVDGTSPWFRIIGRNKKSVVIDLRKAEGREYVNGPLLKLVSGTLTGGLIDLSRNLLSKAMLFWKTSNRDLSDSRQ